MLVRALNFDGVGRHMVLRLWDHPIIKQIPDGLLSVYLLFDVLLRLLIVKDVLLHCCTEDSRGRLVDQLQILHSLGEIIVPFLNLYLVLI